MTPRVSNRNWLLRDVPRTVALVAWLAFAFSVLILFADWPQRAPRQEAANPTPPVDADEQYSGSIIVHKRGEECWQRVLDNRTGKMWDIGVVNCADAMTPVIPDAGASITGADRMRAISKAFGRPAN